MAQMVFTAGGVEVLAARLDLAPGAVRSLSGWLSDAERCKAARFAIRRAGARYIVARARLRELLAARLGIAPQAVAFVYGSRGKPGLAAPFAESGWSFNVAHSEGLALYAFARGCPLGVDVEAIQPLAEADRIAERFFTPRERHAYRAASAQDRALGFYRCWTRKEACLKALGDGLWGGLHEVDTCAPPPGWELHSFVPQPGFVAAVARAIH